MYNRIYSSAEAAMAEAYALSSITGRPVWRHQYINKAGATRWLVSHEENTQIALQGLTP